MDLSLVVASHNEESIIERVNRPRAQDARDVNFGIEIMLVDDNKTDITPGVCNRPAADRPEVVTVPRTSSSECGNAIWKDSLFIKRLLDTFVVRAINIVHISSQSQTYRRHAESDPDTVETGGDVE